MPQSDSFQRWLTTLSQIHPEWEIDFASTADLADALRLCLKGDLAAARPMLRHRVGVRLFDAARAQHLCDLERPGNTHEVICRTIDDARNFP